MGQPDTWRGPLRMGRRTNLRGPVRLWQQNGGRHVVLRRWQEIHWAVEKRKAARRWCLSHRAWRTARRVAGRRPRLQCRRKPEQPEPTRRVTKARTTRVDQGGD